VLYLVLDIEILLSALNSRPPQVSINLTVTTTCCATAVVWQSFAFWTFGRFRAPRDVNALAHRCATVADGHSAAALNSGPPEHLPLVYDCNLESFFLCFGVVRLPWMI
jgi:hypothetical protein